MNQPSVTSLPKRGGRILACLFATAAIAGCGQSASVATFEASDPVATVNGADIDRSVLDLYIENRLQRSAAEVPDEQRDQLLKELSDVYLLTTQSGAAARAKEDPQFQAQFELQYRAMLAQAMARQYMAANSASDDEILSEYERQTEMAPPQFKARHILVDTDNRDAAVDLIKQLNDGADFAALAEEHSTGPSAAQGGDLGWFPAAQMVKPFSDAVQALENGEITQEPVQTQFGWHVILREDSRTSEAPPLDAVRERIKQRVEQQKFETYLQDLRDANAA